MVIGKNITVKLRPYSEIEMMSSWERW